MYFSKIKARTDIDGKSV